MNIFAGDKSRFAIEAGMSKVYERLSFLALGYFVIFVNGRRYGVFEPDASMLACSFGAVCERLEWRGRIMAPAALEHDAGAIADAYRDAIYAPNEEGRLFAGMSYDDFCENLFDRRIVWAPDGDEAFDDWSHVLQLDLGDRVRLIAFKSADEGYHHAPGTLEDLILPADEFYGILQEWWDKFEKAWAEAPKIAEADDGAEPKARL